MEDSTSEELNHPAGNTEVQCTSKHKDDHPLETVEENREQDSFSLIKDEKSADSDVNSEDLSSNDEQSNVNSGSHSQFYESSDSKVDYAVKIDDSDTLSDIDDIKTDTASADSEDSALGSLLPDNSLNEREELQDRSDGCADGSDSGLGSETPEGAKLPSFNLALPCTSSLNAPESGETVPERHDVSNDLLKEDETDKVQQYEYNSLAHIKKPHRSSLKRKCDDNADAPQTKRKKKSISFDNISVYYFPRSQGFSCVPSQGGSTLGMEMQHSHTQHFTLAEHALEQRRLHRQILQQLKSERHSLQGEALSSSEDSDTEEEASDISESELDLDSYYFLQPVPTRQRRALLRGAGVRKIEAYEKDECRDIRTSREFCGCACKGVCNPDNCSCSLAGIKCQVDRLNFPCGCTRDGCGNTTGRIEFNPVRVRTHFIHTLMRIGLEKKNAENQAAAKRQWAAHSVASTTTSCMSNTSYEGERCLTHEDGLLRDVNLTPRVEVESCVNNGSFNNVHCNENNARPQTSMQEDLAYGYRNDASNHVHLSGNNIMHFENTTNHHNHSEPYTSNILQGKGPPYATNTGGFDNMPSNMQNFHGDLNYSYDHHTDNNHFKGLQSFSATSFEEFAHNSQMSMFSHYGHMYVPDYVHKQNTIVNEHASLQYHAMPQNHYEIYKSPTDCVIAENKNDTQYTTLMSLPYQSNNKLQTAENDENWFSQNTLLNLDQSDQTTQDASEIPTQPAATSAERADTTENFGELIKKTMVDSVNV